MRKKALSFALALALSIGLATPVLAVNGAPTFTDVPANNWAYPYVEKAAKNGWISGYTDGRFGPNDKVTYAQFCVMLIGAFFQEQLADYSDPADVWYSRQCGTAAKIGLFDYSTIKGRHTDAVAVGTNLNRYEMAAILYPAVEAAVKKVDTEALEAVEAATPDWSSIPEIYKTSVAVAKTYGLINGVDSAGTFSGDGTMNRAQAAVVLCKFDELVQESQQEEPTIQDNTTPDSSETVVGREADELLFSKEHIRFYYTGWEKNANGYIVKLRIENDSDYKIRGYIPYDSQAKDKRVSMSLTCEADPGRTSEGKITISNEELQKAGLDDFKSIRVRFNVYDAQNDPRRLSFETGTVMIILEPATESQVQSSRKVYVTPTGKRYHYDGNCNGGTYTESTLEQAISDGLTPCDKCVG